MKWRIVTLSLALFAGSTARANFIQVGGVITGGSATRTDGSFSGSVFGPNFSVFGSGPSHDWYVSCLLSPTGPCSAPGSYSMFDGAATPTSESGGPILDSAGGFLNGFCCTTYAGISIQYTLVIPDPGPSPSSDMVLNVPFTALAEVAGSDNQGNSFDLLATGAGIATVTLHHAFENAYFLQSAQYDFFAVPEPATMTLAGLGLLAVILLRRRMVGRLLPGSPCVGQIV